MNRLLSLLQSEENAILSGDYASLQQISEAKAAASKHPETKRMNETTLRRISQLAERNNSLLRAATAGIGDARNALHRLKSGSITEAYDRNGARTQITAQRPGLERKL